MTHETISADIKAILIERRGQLDPVALLHSIRETQSALAAIVSPEVRATPTGESLERFLAKLPDRWRQDEVMASRPKKVREPRTWRTRPDPFEGVWCEILGWLQEEPDATAVTLLNRLQSTYPDRFDRTHLRTLQRRVQQWRGIMASKLVYPVSAELAPAECSIPQLELVQSGARP